MTNNTSDNVSTLRQIAPFNTVSVIPSNYTDTLYTSVEQFASLKCFRSIESKCLGNTAKCSCKNLIHVCIIIIIKIIIKIIIIKNIIIINTTTTSSIDN